MPQLPKSFKTVEQYRTARLSRPAHPEPGGDEISVTILGDNESMPGSIQQALDFFDAESGVETGDRLELPRPSTGPATSQTLTPVGSHQEGETIEPRPLPRANLPQLSRQDYPGGSFVERHASGKVARIRSSGGDIASFNYDDHGRLCRFFYAALEWTQDSRGFWNARDRQSDFIIEGSVEVQSDGSIHIVKPDVRRIVKLNGSRIDEHANGSQAESRKLKNTASPYDLLSRSKPIGSVWRTQTTKPLANHNERLTLEQLFHKIPEEVPAISEEICQASVAALLEASSPETGEARGLPPASNPNVTRVTQESREYFNKACLWLWDRVKGQSSASHIPYLDNLADIYFQKQQYDLAELTHLRSLHIKEQYYGVRQPELAVNFFGLARVHREWGNLQRSEQMYQQALELFDKGVRKYVFLTAHHLSNQVKLAQFVESMVDCINALADVYEQQMKISAGRKLCGKALSFWDEILGKGGTSVDQRLVKTISLHRAALRERGESTFGFEDQN